MSKRQVNSPGQPAALNNGRGRPHDPQTINGYPSVRQSPGLNQQIGMIPSPGATSMPPPGSAPQRPQIATKRPAPSQEPVPYQCSCSGIKQELPPNEPYIRIVEEPQMTGLRFRYLCEGKSAGSIMGASSEGDRKTHPEIKIENHYSSAIVVVSCVTKDHPHKPHPHQLVGPGCDKGIFTMRLSGGQTSCVLQNIGIQCCKRSDIQKNLKIRQENRVDPFGTGISEENIDPCVVRLCFQAFLPDTESRKFTRILSPIVSQPIYDKKAMKELIICRMSESSCCVSGGKEIFLLCEKVNKGFNVRFLIKEMSVCSIRKNSSDKLLIDCLTSSHTAEKRDDIMVKFTENDSDGNTVWEAYGKFAADDVHRQLAIVFTAPPYHNRNINRSVKVEVQLVRPSDGAISEPKPFHYYPLDTDPYGIERKRQKMSRQGYDFSADLQKNMSWMKNLHTPGSMNIPAAAGAPSAGGASAMIPDFAVLTSLSSLPSAAEPPRRPQGLPSVPPAGGPALPQYTLDNLNNLPRNFPANIPPSNTRQQDNPAMFSDLMGIMQQNTEFIQLQPQQQQLQQQLQQLPADLLSQIEALENPGQLLQSLENRAENQIGSDLDDIFINSGETNAFVELLDLTPDLMSLADPTVHQFNSLNFDDNSAQGAPMDGMDSQGGT